MIRIAVDTPLGDKLRVAAEQVELCDANGQTLGLFLPLPAYADLVRPEDNCPYSAEELSRLHQQTGGRPLADILKDLQAT